MKKLGITRGYIVFIPKHISISNSHYNRLADTVLTFTHDHFFKEKLLDISFFLIKVSKFKAKRNLCLLHGQIFINYNDKASEIWAFCVVVRLYFHHGVKWIESNNCRGIYFQDIIRLLCLEEH